MAARGVTRGELLSAGSAVVLLVLMLAVAWYGVDGTPGRGGAHGGRTFSETGWDGLTGIRWLVLVTLLVALAALAAHLGRPPRQAIAGLRLATLVLGSATAVALLIRVLIDLPSANRVVDQKLGAVLGVLVALVVVLGAADAVREQRVRLASQR